MTNDETWPNSHIARLSASKRYALTWKQGKLKRTQKALKDHTEEVFDIEEFTSRLNKVKNGTCANFVEMAHCRI